MARNYILGGMAGTQLQAGKPYFKRIVIIDGQQGTNRRVENDALHPASDGFTCRIDGQGRILFNQNSTNWDANADGLGGELLMVEFPTTLRNVQILLEEAWAGGVKQIPADGDALVRCKIALTAEGQDVQFDEPTSSIANPIQNGNYIEIKPGESATINSRTKVIFILIQKFTSSDILDPSSGLVVGPGTNSGVATDAVSLLVTGVLDHEPTSGGSQAALEPNSQVVNADSTTRELRKIWGKADGIG